MSTSVRAFRCRSFKQLYNWYYGNCYSINIGQSEYSEVKTAHSTGPTHGGRRSWLGQRARVRGWGGGGGGVAGDQSGIGVMEKGKAEEESEKRCGKIEYRLRKNGRITMTLIYLVLKLSARVTFWVAIS